MNIMLKICAANGILGWNGAKYHGLERRQRRHEKTHGVFYLYD